MKAKVFSETILPAPFNGRDTSPYPALIQIDAFRWMHVLDFSYWDASGNRWTVSAGRITDLASIPRLLWAILPPYGAYTGPATIHDDLYARQITTREFADNLLLEMMPVANVSQHETDLIYAGVRAGGQHAWDQHTAELNANKGNP